MYTSECTADHEIFMLKVFHALHFVWFNFHHWTYWQKLDLLKSIKHVTLLPWKMPCCCSCTYLPITYVYGRVDLYLQGSCLPSSRYALSCLLHLLIGTAIALAGVAADSDLGSGRAPTGDAAESSSSFTRGGVRYIARAYYLPVKKFTFLIFVVVGTTKIV